MSLLSKLREFYVDVLNDQERQLVLYFALYAAAAGIAALSERRDPRGARPRTPSIDAESLADMIAARLHDRLRGETRDA